MRSWAHTHWRAAEAACSLLSTDALVATPDTEEELAAIDRALSQFTDRAPVWAGASVPRNNLFFKHRWMRRIFGLQRMQPYDDFIRLHWIDGGNYDSRMSIRNRWYFIKAIGLAYYGQYDRRGKGIGFDWMRPGVRLPPMCQIPALEDVCVPCPAGHYSAEGGGCARCPPGTTTSFGANSIEGCVPCQTDGFYADQELGICAQCPRGRWLEPAGQGQGRDAMCPACPAGDADPEAANPGWFARETLQNQQSQAVRAHKDLCVKVLSFCAARADLCAASYC